MMNVNTMAEYWEIQTICRGVMGPGRVPCVQSSKP